MALEPIGLLIYTRPGFEGEASREVLERTSERGIHGHVKALEGEGFVLFFPYALEGTASLEDAVRYRDLIFARQLIVLLDRFEDLPKEDRLSPLIESLVRGGQKFSEVFLETADTNEAKELSAFLKKFERPLQRALLSEGLMGEAHLPRLHVFFETGTRVFLGQSFRGRAAEPLMGIPRLRFPKEAPSRSTLKLDEAFLHFVEDPEKALVPGMRAVDLGAAPGGWTYQLVRRHIRVIAVDNGPMAPFLLDSGLVEHLRVDGFRYRPPKKVDWLVCDMVEQPERVARLVADWFQRGDTERAIFNLKLPMKKRWQMVESCRTMITGILDRNGIPYQLSFKQLYHDRAEVTAYLAPPRR